jgi:hypothetical protein
MRVVCTSSVSTRFGLASVKQKYQQTQQLKTTHELWFQVQDDRQRSVADMLGARMHLDIIYFF